MYSLTALGAGVQNQGLGRVGPSGTRRASLSRPLSWFLVAAGTLRAPRLVQASFRSLPLLPGGLLSVSLLRHWLRAAVGGVT